VTFDGTGISVFDLKREILITNKLQATADNFDLKVINSDSKEEYTDDTEVIPRSTSVIARRLPTARPGSKDSAAKYVSGNMSFGGPRGSHRSETAKGFSQTSVGGPAAVTGSGDGNSEEDMINAMFQAQGEQWKQTQEHMANASPVYYPSNSKNAMLHVPDHPPPPGYTCYRCGQKGHWIQGCPTNNDPNWENKRVKRTTGIPRSMLKTVAKPADDSSGTYLIDANGEYVVQVADENSWKTFQEKAKQRDLKSDKPLDPELECPLSHKLFVKPVKTPCCKTTYSEEAIQEALLDSDFVCPNCKTEEVLLDQLVPDEDMEKRVKEYREKMEGKEKSPEPTEEDAENKNKRKREDEKEEVTDDRQDGLVTNEELDAKRVKHEPSGSPRSDGGSKSPVEGEGRSSTAAATTAEGTPDPMATMPMFGMPGLPGMNSNVPPMPPGMMPGMPMPGMPFMMPGMPMPPMPFMMPPFMPPMPFMMPPSNPPSNSNNQAGFQDGSDSSRGPNYSKP
jgi:protein MPE1